MNGRKEAFLAPQEIARFKMLVPLVSVGSWVRFVAAFFGRTRADIILAGMPRSFLVRVWDAVKPPPALPARRRLNRAQRRLLRGTAIVLGVGASAWGVYAYIASAPERAHSDYQQGMRLLGPDDFRSAAAQFTKAIDILPDYADAYLGRGKARQAAGDSEAALADFEKAIAIDPTLESAYTSRGVVWRLRGDIPKALADFTESIHLQPTADAYYQRGLAYQTLNQPQRAVEDYDLAIHRDPGAPYLYRARAKAKRDLGDTDGAREDQEVAERVEKTQ
jgi:tetratricopeptide (TPR) repeat protein